MYVMVYYFSLNHECFYRRRFPMYQNAILIKLRQNVTIFYSKNKKTYNQYDIANFFTFYEKGFTIYGSLIDW